MKAFLCREHGDLNQLVLEDIDTPEPGPGEVQIRVRACGINFADSLMVGGTYQATPQLPFVPGTEIAGEITALGEGVSDFDVGDLVMGLPGRGGYGEYLTTNASRVVPVPESLSVEQAASFAITYGTSHVALAYRARLQKGETLVVHGAAGGTGLSAVEVGVAMGATVIATAGGPEKLKIPKAAGATHLIDYRAEDIRTRVKELTGGKGADVIFDPVGGDVFDASLRCIAFEGRILVIGFAGGETQQIKSNHVLVKNVDIIGVNRPAYDQYRPDLVRQSNETLIGWLAEGKIKPLVSKTIPLEDAVNGLRAVINRKTTGKVVITP
ncbi:MAG: NADPH:quinone oxidoreductase family protein [Alphaproteobacteria bacterium]